MVSADRLPSEGLADQMQKNENLPSLTQVWPPSNQDQNVKIE
jgi:hypothetical protein